MNSKKNCPLYTNCNIASNKIIIFNFNLFRLTFLALHLSSALFPCLAFSHPSVICPYVW